MEEIREGDLESMLTRYQELKRSIAETNHARATQSQQERERLQTLLAKEVAEKKQLRKLLRAVEHHNRQLLETLEAEKEQTRHFQALAQSAIDELEAVLSDVNQRLAS